ncbi:MAG: helix-hairpin-helix domain-containing protein [Deltaproteobacteria bacterium]|nr:helix-hairpin-helix domain-containing protein [Deltaproteobacteria bacterium]MBW2394732.1 helix-hairpin-helix domain-containing protein [Deltaproteobacteria bacterium]
MQRSSRPAQQSPLPKFELSRQSGAALALAAFLLVVPLLREADRQVLPGWADGPQGEVSAVGGLLFGKGLDPNDASALELTVLPGIGPARADAIVAQRTRTPFCRPADLERVHGLGPRTVARLRDWLAIEPGAPGCPAAASKG